MTPIHVNVPYAMLYQRIDFAVENRINPEIYFDAADLDEGREGDVKRLAALLEQNGLEVTIHGPFTDLSPGGQDRRVKEVTRNRFLKTMEWARILRPKTIVFHPGYEKRQFDENVDLWLESSVETWSPLVEEAEKSGLVFAIENVFEETPDSLKRLLDRVHSSHFRFCFDTGHYHAFSMRKVSLSGWIDALGGYLGEVHLHDNHGEKDEHLPMGEGGFDFTQFFALLSGKGLKPVFTIEPHEEAHLRRGWAAARKYIGTP